MRLDAALKEFGDRVGISNLSLSDTGVSALNIENVGTLYFEFSTQANENEILIYVTCAIPSHDRTTAQNALAFCHYKYNRPFAVYAGVHKDNLIVLTRLNERQATGQLIENVAIFLTKSLDDIVNHNF